MARSVDQQICFRLANAVPAASLPGPLRLGDAQAEAVVSGIALFRRDRAQPDIPARPHQRHYLAPKFRGRMAGWLS